VYVDDIIFGSTNKELCKAFKKLIKDKFQMSSIGELTFFLGLQLKQKQDGIFISQDKYVAEILRKFGFIDVKSASTPIDIEKPLLNDPDGEDVDVHTYRSMIGSLMYLTSSKPDIMYLKGKTHLGLWYPKDSPFNLVAYSDSDYAEANLDRKSTTGGCQFLGCILISWKCKKQTVVATSSTEAEYVTAASCCAQVLWIQNQLLDYRLTMQVNKSSMKLLEWTLHVTNVSSAGQITTPQMTSVSIKKSNDVVRLQALIDRKQVIITEDFIRQALRLDDADSVDCLPKEEIFGELARMEYEKLRIGKGFYGVDTPLFDGMLVPQQAQDVEDTTKDEDADNKTCATLTKQVANLEQDKVAQAIEITKLKQKVRRRIHPNKEGIIELDADKDVTLEEVDAEVTMDANVQGRLEESQAKVYHLDLEYAKKVLTKQDTDEIEPAKVKEVIKVIEVVTAAKLMTEVVTSAATTITTALVPKASAPKRKRGVIIQEPEEAVTASVIVQLKIKEDLEMLWKLVQERFQSSDPKNFLDDFLLNTLKIMFEKHNVKASIWTDQKGRYGLAKVKSWKIFESCGVHILTLTTTQMILLVEKKYPLTRFTLKQMLNNVRLEVEEESEMSLELLSFGVDAIEDFKNKYAKGLLLLVEELNAADLDPAKTLSPQTKFSLSGFGFIQAVDGVRQA
nr:uncharacterized mitochondrial protein AtMg00810-like [Tanacetum cinerariifolium]